MSWKANVYMLRSLCVLLLIQKSIAYTFNVTEWGTPNHYNYSEWASRNRFQIGDTIVFRSPNNDSVLLVTKEQYKECNKNHLGERKDGNTSFTLNHSGHFYFISGSRDRCNKNEKLEVVVMADRRHRSSAPSPSPLVPEVTPSPAPNRKVTPPTEKAPSPSPSGPEAPMPSPADSPPYVPSQESF
ncbi:unnamed protein product, partial [Cuscuta epithymum]